MAEAYPHMFTVYVLKSLKNAKRYIGYTAKSVEQRLKEHNSGLSTFTSRNGSFEIMYTEVYSVKKEAIQREKFLKSGKGREFLDRIHLGP